MLFLKRVWAFLKTHWYLVFIGVAAIVALLLKKKDLVDWKKFLKASRDSHEKEIKAIDAAHKQEIADREAAFRRMEEARAKVQAEFDRNQRELDEQKKKEVERILKKTKDDPEAMAKELEKATGYKVFIAE